MFAAALAAAPRPAVAATPASGSVSSASAETGWTGAVDGAGAGPTAYAAAGGTQGLCQAPQCDTYTLEVREAAARLQLRARTDNAVDAVGMEVTEPDGTTTYVYNGTEVAEFKRERPATGTWTVKLLASSGRGPDDVRYSGRATLVLAEPPKPGPAPPASPDHPRSSPDVATPSPAARPPGALRVRVGADATSPALAVRRGLRVRVRCSGGCAAVRMRLVWNRRVIGHLAITRGADGRATGSLRILRRHARAVRRARRVPLTLLATASASDGRSATTSLSLTLRR